MITLDINECAAFLKINRSTAQAKAKRGEIPGARIGRAWVFLLSDLVNYLHEESNRQQTERKESKRPKVAPPFPLPITPSVRARNKRRPLPNLEQDEATHDL